MECLWGLFGHWQQDGNCHQQHPQVLYVCLYPYSRFANSYLHGTGFLAEYEKIYLGSEKESLVLSVRELNLLAIIKKD